MKKLLSATTILFSLVCVLNAQQRRLGAQGEVRINRNMPSVYLTFERAGQVKVTEPSEERARVWLRFRNNTRWTIMLNMSGVPSEEYGDAGVFFDVISDGNLVSREECHVCTLNGVGPGKSLVFSVSRGDLSEGRSIRVRFSYSWENQDDVFAGREAEHYVYFYASQLPKTSQEGKK
jgi:hypothetical protein